MGQTWVKRRIGLVLGSITGKRKSPKTAVLSHSWGFVWLREKDLNQRPPGYEPDELPTALSRDMWHSLKCLAIIYHPFKKINPFFIFFLIFCFFLVSCFDGVGCCAGRQGRRRFFAHSIRDGNRNGVKKPVVKRNPVNEKGAFRQKSRKRGE